MKHGARAGPRPVGSLGQSGRTGALIPGHPPDALHRGEPTHYGAVVMLSMFVLWFVVFIGVFLRRRWTIPLTIVSLVWTVVLLRLHMTDPIPLSF